MRLLVDTHALFWSVMKRIELSHIARSALEDERNEVYVSVASAWEIAIKVGLAKWPDARNLLLDFERNVDDAGFVLLPIGIPHVRAAGLMQTPHRDPFDRLLAAQAIAEGLVLVTADAKVQGLGAQWLW